MEVQDATQLPETTPVTRGELRTLLSAKLKQLVPEVVGAEISETVKPIVERRSKAVYIPRRTVERIYWPPISQSNQPVPDENY